MRNTGRLLAGIVMLLMALCSAAAAGAAELTVESYSAVSVAHLELIATRWEGGNAPSEAEEDALFERHATTREAYYTFAGDHSDAIQSYLDANPEIRKTIEELSARIKMLIEQAETVEDE